jgi:hypothetical protein
MNRQPYFAPETLIMVLGMQETILITSGADAFHEGGGGFYGSGDINDIDYLF